MLVYKNWDWKIFKNWRTLCFRGKSKIKEKFTCRKKHSTKRNIEGHYIFFLKPGSPFAFHVYSSSICSSTVLMQPSSLMISYISKTNRSLKSYWKVKNIKDKEQSLIMDNSFWDPNLRWRANKHRRINNNAYECNWWV